MYKREPQLLSVTDQSELAFIRRVNLDVFWSREKSTVRGIVGKVKETIRRGRIKGRPLALPSLESWPVEDGMGMGTAILMLEKSLDKGVNDSYTQFDTCRMLRSVYADIYSASSALLNENRVFKSRRGDILRLHGDPMQSPLMERFVKDKESEPSVSGESSSGIAIKARN